MSRLLGREDEVWSEVAASVFNKRAGHAGFVVGRGANGLAVAFLPWSRLQTQ